MTTTKRHTLLPTRRAMKLRRVLSAAAFVVAASTPLMAQQPRAGAVPSIEERTTGLRKLDGYFPVYWDERTGTLLLEIPRFDSDFLYNTGLSAGLGSND